MNGHSWYTDKDFTNEEIGRENFLAVAVLKDQRKICKYCGSEDIRLPCSRQCITLKTLMSCIAEQQKARGVIFAEMSQEARKAYAAENGLALFVEVGELVSSWPFASWKTNGVDRANLAREIVDCYFFLSNIASCFLLTAEDLQDKFEWVLENNYKRIDSGEHKEVIIK